METEVARGILSFREGVNAAKKELILKALSRTQGNRLAAAKALGLHEKYLLQLIKTLRITDLSTFGNAFYGLGREKCPIGGGFQVQTGFGKTRFIVQENK